MKVFVTKYALTTGIMEKEVEVSSASDKMVFENAVAVRYPACYHKPYWYETKEEAIEHAEVMRKRKIESLKKSILKLEKLNFNN